MFSARKRLTEADYEGHLLIRLIANGLSLIAAHTNLDQASGGMNDTLAGLLGLENIVGEGFLRVGDLSAPMTAEAFADFAARQLGDTVRVMGHREALIHRVGLCSGGGCDEWADAHAMGADAFLTGEVKHHIALDASYHGVVLLEAGHFATENPGIFALMKALQNAPDIVQWKCTFRAPNAARMSDRPCPPARCLSRRYLWTSLLCYGSIKWKTARLTNSNRS